MILPFENAVIKRLATENLLPDALFIQKDRVDSTRKTTRIYFRTRNPFG